jgi:hypothetical protein
MSVAKAGENVGAHSTKAIPLACAVFNWPKPSSYPIAHEGPMIQVSGRMVGALLSWLSRARPGVMKDASPWDVGLVGWELQGLSETLRGLSAAHLEGIPADAEDIHFFLANATGDLAARLLAIEEADEETKAATVTIPAPATEAT